MNRHLTKLLLTALALCALAYILLGQQASALIERPLAAIGLGLIGLGMIVESRRRAARNAPAQPRP